MTGIFFTCWFVNGIKGPLTEKPYFFEVQTQELKVSFETQ